MSKLSWTLLLVASMAGIAAFYPIVKALDNSIDPYLLAFLRFLIALLALLPIMAFRRSLRLPSPREWPLFIFIALCGAGATVLVVIGIGQTNSVVSAILLNTNPLIIALLAPLLISEQLTVKKSLALTAGFIGVILIVLNGQSLSALINSEYFWGSFIVLIAALLSGLNKIYSKGLVRTYDGLYVTFFAVVLGTSVLSVIVGFTGKFGQITQLTGTDVISVLLIGIVASAVPWTIWTSSLKHLDVHVAASFMLLIPIFAMFYSFLFLSEQFTVWMLLGLLLTSGGVYLVQREEKVVPNI